MQTALFAEAEQLYRDAKLASFAGHFEQADAKHTASALIFERLGETELAARAYMRSVWYKIQNHTDSAIEEIVLRAMGLSEYQALAGLHQALEFAAFEGTEKSFAICSDYLVKLLARRSIPLPSDWNNAERWGRTYSEIAISIYAAMVQAAAATGSERWVWSDQARLFYFKSILSEVSERPDLLLKAADSFSRYDIEYRSQLCRAESRLWAVMRSRQLWEAGRLCEQLLHDLRSISTFSLGVLAFAKLLSIYGEISLFYLTRLGYKCESIIPPEITDLAALVETRSWSESEGVFRDTVFATIPDLLKGSSLMNMAPQAIVSKRANPGEFQLKRMSLLRCRTAGYKLPQINDFTSLGPNQVIVRPKQVTSADYVHLPAVSNSGNCLVFVHGWNGHKIETWGGFPDLLGTDRDLPNLDVFFWGYPTGVFGSHPGIKAVADFLRTELRLRFKHHTFVLVGHSLGGLIIKQMILRTLSEDTEFLQRIKWIVLFATPHLGSHLAQYGRQFISQMQDLTLNAELLTEMEQEWVRRTRGASMDSPLMHLTNVRGIQDTIVTEWSSITVNDDYEAINGSHTSIVKPTSADDLAYLIVKDRVTRAFALSTSTVKVQ